MCKIYRLVSNVHGMHAVVLTLSFRMYAMCVQAYNLPVVQIFHTYSEQYLNPEHISVCVCVYIYIYMNSCRVIDTDILLCSMNPYSKYNK